MPQLTMLSDTDVDFPSTELALIDPDGLLAIGGDLSCNRLSNAYQHGIFPWFNEHDPIMWWSPSIRCVIPCKAFHVSKSFKKFLNKSDFVVSINKAFPQVINHCKATRKDGLGTWINQDMESAYIQLHHRHIAHSVEVWQNDKLVGGLYGIFTNHTFCGESMFSLLPNASKTALYALSQLLIQSQVPLIDCQIVNPHLTSLGAIEIKRAAFIEHLKQHQHTATKVNWQPRDIYGK